MLFHYNEYYKMQMNGDPDQSALIWLATDKRLFFQLLIIAFLFYQ